jgi:cytochrome b561
MPLRNGPHGYGLVTKLLHWATVVALATQFVVGYAMRTDDGGFEKAECDRPSDRVEERCEQQQESLETRAEDPLGTAYSDLGSGQILGGGINLPELHVLLGLLVLTLAVARVVWRRTAGLPPWAEGLSPGERTLAHWTEKSLLVLLFLIPLSGLSLVLVSYDLLPLHIAAHIGFFATVATHLGLVLKHQLMDRDRLVSRML